ncbi:hypothetical protein HYDPIDRAFT_108975 [Hydnomerulius pinastri MD-312]|nr:hypothetical protein HYDPIDRAFT_108975 [Hydnomerulius pinastri MD-312]
MFGWSRSHSYEAHVLSKGALADDWYEPGMDDCVPCPEFPCDELERDAEVMATLWMRYAYDEIYCVLPKITRKDCVVAKAPIMSDWMFTLADVWAPEEVCRVRHGHRANPDIGIKYMCDGWTVHITCQKGDVFHTLPARKSSNLPVFKDALGVPSQEDLNALCDTEHRGEYKLISSHLFDPTYFEAYCAGDVTSLAGDDQLEIAKIAENATKRTEETSSNLTLEAMDVDDRDKAWS